MTNPEKKSRTTRTINLRLDVWQKLHFIYAQNPNLNGLSDTIDMLIKKNKLYRQKIMELEGKFTEDIKEQKIEVAV